MVNEARVVDDEGARTPVGEVGELMLRNPTVTPGYWGMPDETAAAITPDGWLHTGDLVTEDGHGVYTFVARKKEVLRRRGENLSPAEVEDVLAAHPDVLECAVVGVPSDLSEEDIKAFVVTSGPADFPALRAWAGERLSKFKVPRYWQQVRRAAAHADPARREASAARRASRRRGRSQLTERRRPSRCFGIG